MIGPSAFEDLVRRERGPILGALMRRFGDLDLAEDAYAEAVLTAWERWPIDGPPSNPGGWLLTTARNKALDRVRHESQRPSREAAAVGVPSELVRPGADVEAEESGALDDDPIDAASRQDDQLRLLFLCCHPALAEDAQVALTLRTVGGLTTGEIARAYAVPESTLAQRIVRAKKKIALAGIPFALPTAQERPARLAAVLHVVYLVFNEGYAATGTDSVVRPDLCAEAIRIGRALQRLAPEDPEVAGLLALMLLHDARRASRETADGRLVPLAEQDRSLWDRQRINEGCSIVEWALQHGPLGPYQVQAAIAALHADAETAESTDWKQISLLYGMLERLAPSAWVELNRAVAIAEVRGPAEGLRLLDQLEASGDLAGVHRLPAARAHLLQRLGRTDEAAEAFERALELAPNEPERAYLRERLALLSPSRPG